MMICFIQIHLVIWAIAQLLVMKLVKKVFSLTPVLIVIVLQSCGITGKNASVRPAPPPVQADINMYKADAERDSSLKMISLTNYLQPLTADWPYAGRENFTGSVLYKNPAAYLRLPAARALKAVQAELAARGLGIKIFDAYRPYSVTKKMWEIVPDERYAANPAKGSGHNRGIAVDLTLVELASGNELKMPTGFDDFSERAHHDYMQLDREVIANRALLRSVMEKHGYKALETEWWHYYLPDAARYPLMDFDFEQMERLSKY
jgi:D-alanyl-D-alanine dipeptidase